VYKLTLFGSVDSARKIYSDTESVECHYELCGARFPNSIRRRKHEIGHVYQFFCFCLRSFLVFDGYGTHFRNVNDDLNHRLFVVHRNAMDEFKAFLIDEGVARDRVDSLTWKQHTVRKERASRVWLQSPDSVSDKCRAGLGFITNEHWIFN
jgi:hypothetical protein